MSKATKDREWPYGCQQRAFAEGANWLLTRLLEQRAMWVGGIPDYKHEAIRRYGAPPEIPHQPITARQLAILRFIRESIDKRGGQPTIREIGSKFLIQSTNGVVSHLRSLLRKGLIARHGRGIIALTNAGIEATNGGGK